MAPKKKAECNPPLAQAGTRTARNWHGQDDVISYSIQHYGNPDSTYRWWVYLHKDRQGWSRSGDCYTLEEAIEGIRGAVKEAEDYYLHLASKVKSILGKRAFYNETEHKTEVITITAPRTSVKTTTKKPKLFG